MQHGKLRAHRCSGLVNWVFPPLVRKVRPQHLHRRTQCAIILRPSQQRHEVGVNAVRTWSKTRTKKNIKNREDGEAQGELLHDLPEWLEEFADSSVDGEVSTVREAHASSSPKPPPKVVSGRHTTYTYFPKDRNCEVYAKEPKL